MDYTDSVKYFFFRLVLLIGTNAMGLLLGKVLLWCFSNFVPASAMGFKSFLVSDATGSVMASIVMAVLLALVFHDDAKKHAAYDDMDAVPVAIVLLLLLAFYFVPSIFYNPADITKSVSTVYYMFYYPTHWLTELFGAAMKTAAAAGMGLVLGVQMIVYQATYSAYKKKHPFLFKHDDAEGKMTAETAD